MRFRYRRVKVRHPVASLGGVSFRPRTLVRISVIGPSGVYIEDGLLDTGADDVVLPEKVAAKIGVDLTHAPVGEASGIGTLPARIRYAQVTLRITDGIEYRQWNAWAGFTPAGLKQPLLGFAGFHKFFAADYHGDREVVELTVNPLYPGT